MWCHAKQYTRAKCDDSFAGLEKTIETALESVSLYLIKKYFRKTREYHRAYREGNEIAEIKGVLKQYKIKTITS